MHQCCGGHARGNEFGNSCGSRCGSTMRRARSASSLSAPAAGAVAASVGFHRAPSGKSFGARRAPQNTQRQVQGNLPANRQDGKVRMSRVESPPLSYFPDAIILLFQEPLNYLHATLCGEDEEVVVAGGLCPLLSFVQRLLSSLTDIQQVIVDVNSKRHRDSAVSWLDQTREELSLWGQCAGKAVRGLAASASMRSNLGARMRSLQERLDESLEGAARLRYENDNAVARETSDLRAELQAAKVQQERDAAEKTQWNHTLEILVNGFEERDAAKHSEWRRMLQDIVCDSRGSSQSHEHMEVLQRLADSWSGQSARWDHEMRILQDRAEITLTELRHSEGAVEATKTRAIAEHAELIAAQSAHNQTLAEFKAERQTHNEALSRAEAQAAHVLDQALMRAREDAAEVLAQERKERAAVLMQLNEAMEMSASKDQTITQLRQSFLDDTERARGPPLQTEVPSDISAFMPVSNGAGPVPAMVMQSSSIARSSPGLSGWARPPLAAHSLVSTQSRDGTSSVCRISTESTPFAALASIPPLPSSAGYPTGHATPSNPSRRRLVAEIPRSDTSVCAAASSSSQPRSSGASSAAPECMTGADTISTAATVEPGGALPSGPVWELPAKDFLSQWRRSWDSERPSEERMSSVLVEPSSAAAEPKALRITASFD